MRKDKRHGPQTHRCNRTGDVAAGCAGRVGGQHHSRPTWTHGRRIGSFLRSHTDQFRVTHPPFVIGELYDHRILRRLRRIHLCAQSNAQHAYRRLFRRPILLHSVRQHNRPVCEKPIWFYGRRRLELLGRSQSEETTIDPNRTWDRTSSLASSGLVSHTSLMAGMR